MNLIIGSPWWLVALLALALAAAAVEDALRLRISNLTCAAVFAGAVAAMAVHGFSSDLWQNALVCLAILAVGTMAFAAGWLGGGDIKLLAAIGLWIDLRAATGLITAVFIAGGLVALVYLVVRQVVPSRRAIDSRHSRIPYGLAIVAGAAFVFTIQLSDRRTDPFLGKLPPAATAKALG